MKKKGSMKMVFPENTRVHIISANANANKERIEVCKGRVRMKIVIF